MIGIAFRGQYYSLPPEPAFKTSYPLGLSWITKGHQCFYSVLCAHEKYIAHCAPGSGYPAPLLFVPVILLTSLLDIWSAGSADFRFTPIFLMITYISLLEVNDGLQN